MVEQVKNRSNNPNITEDSKATQWQPNESGNPNGRPISSLTTLLKEYLNADDEKEKAALVEAWVKTAKSPGRGQVSALKEILDRVEGKVDSTLNLKGDIPVSIRFIRASEAIESTGEPPKELKEGNRCH